MKKNYVFNNEQCTITDLPPRLKMVNPICLDLLYKRGFKTADAMEAFLFPSLTTALKATPPLLGMDRAVTIIQRAVAAKAPTVIYHDYDADGITAAAVAYELLKGLGMPVHCYCNERTMAGFGICASGVDDLMAKYPDTKLLITVDNGITGLDGVAHAKELGLAVIVTDHHEPDEQLPAANAVINHKRKDEPENQDKNCCGAGVIWKVMFNLYLAMGQDLSPVMNTLDIVALGTVADIVPLLGHNRALVQEGLKLANSGHRAFFSVAAQVLELQTIDAQAISFKLAPMLNAVSRMGYDAGAVVKLLVMKNEEKVRAGIEWLLKINQERKDETARETELAKAAVSGPLTKHAIVFREESLQEGIVGIVAGQLKEEFNLPCAVFAPDKDGNWKGSCRSVDGFHLKEALDKCSDYLLSYGGHAKAAGLTVRASDFDLFQKKFEALADAAAGEHGFPYETTIDLAMHAPEYTEQLVQELRILEPYGEGFPAPLFGVVADITDVKYMGDESQHVKYIDKSGLSIIQWHQGEKARTRKKLPTKFVGTPQLNNFRGNITVQFIAE